MTETLTALVTGHRSGAVLISATIERVYQRIAAAADPAIFISLREEEAVQVDASLLACGDPSLPLFGVPVAVKDNIDVVGLPTTAACPAYSYAPQKDATVVSRLKRAGAIIIGKTNLDQFATGLVGARSPYGMPRNPLRADLVSGGSSSGSAVAVARGIVPLALGTDTAGSGRVPAGFNNIVGVKPSVGLVPATGVVPACRSLDCVSIFALTVEDAFAALAVMAGHDERDPYSRQLALGAFSGPAPEVRIGVPRREDKLLFGDEAATGFAGAERMVQAMGARLVEIDLTPFFAAAKLLYEGPWLAERVAAVGDFIAARPQEVLPVTRQIISQGMAKSGVETFRGLYRLAELRGQALKALAGIDALMVPTMPTLCTVADVERDPIGPNSQLGTFTNFVNLLDMAGIAVPVSLASDGTPFGVTLLAGAGRDAALAGLGAAIHARTGLSLGALGAGRPPEQPAHAGVRSDELVIGVVGAHMSGMALNGEVIALGGRFLQRSRTAGDYRLFALEGGGKVSRPGLLRVVQGAGQPIELETWALPAEGFARFVAAVPPPLSIGTIALHDGSTVKGFLVEAQATVGARDITSSGGWRAFLATKRPQA